jgi:very-short-patch-repair endonuclease
MPHTPLPPNNRTRAKSMRRVMTDPELKLWNELRAHRLMGLGFRRQFPVAGYIVDFACPAKRLILELDGTHHGEADVAAADGVRSKRLADDGWTVLRFWNADVLADIDGVCRQIVTVAGLAAQDAARQAAALAASQPMIDHHAAARSEA